MNVFTVSYVEEMTHLCIHSFFFLKLKHIQLIFSSSELSDVMGIAIGSPSLVSCFL